MFALELYLWLGLIGHVLVYGAIDNHSGPSKMNATNLTGSSGRLSGSDLQTQHRFSVNETESAKSEEVDFSKLLRLKDVLNLFDINVVAFKWKAAHSEFSANCRRDIKAYFQGLNAADLWAVKMDDSSGHYSSGFFYGNNYWMGSKPLCLSIHEKNSVELAGRPDTNPTNNAGLPFSKMEHLTYHSIQNESPPFIPGFFIVKMFLNESFPTNVLRIIYIGVCLPTSCSPKDVKKLVELGQHQHPNRDVQLLDIRTTNQVYNIFEDKTFWTLIATSAVVLILMILGTLYEIFLTRTLQTALHHRENEMINSSETSSGIGCASSDYGDSMTNTSLKKESLKELNIVLNLAHTSGNNKCFDENLEEHLAEPRSLSVYSEILLSFSIITNFNTICDRNVGSDTIPSIHGLRALSMAWVILGHTCIVMFKYSDNMEMRKDVEENFFFQAVTSGTFSVDTFFFISGFLVSYLYFRTNAKGKLSKLTKGTNKLTAGVVHFLGLVAYRFMRLTAPYVFVLGVVQVSMKHLASHSIFEPPTSDHVTCSKYWWRNVLYINTLFPVEQMCMLWSWYLANDTQFYIIGAVILIIGAHHVRPAAYTTLVFLLLSWTITAVIAFTNNHRPHSDDPLALFDKIYDKPWTRLGPYLIGMAVGWILFRSNCKIRLSRLTVIAAWIIALLNLFVLVFGLYRSELSQITAAAYSSLSHSAWALSLAWITIACSTGYGGYVNTLLSAPWLYPFSRVTYCAYLVHPIIIRSVVLNSSAPTHLGGDTMVVTFFGLVVSSYLLSFLVSLSFEAPVVTLLKIPSPGRKKRFV